MNFRVHLYKTEEREQFNDRSSLCTSFNFRYWQYHGVGQSQGRRVTQLCSVRITKDKRKGVSTQPDSYRDSWQEQTIQEQTPGLHGLPGEDSYSQTNRLQTTPRSLLSGRSQGRFKHQDNLATALKGMELMITSMKTTALWKVKYMLPAKKETLPSQWHQQHPIKLPTSLPLLYKLQFP